MNIWKLSTIAFAGLFAGTIALGSITSASAEPQPNMRNALDSLRVAANHLERASHDKGGHRAKALQLTREAIYQVQDGIKFDNRH